MKTRVTERKETKHTKVGDIKVSKQMGFPKKTVAGVKDASIAFKTKKK